MDESPDLRINLLGELSASLDGTVLDLGGKRQRAVLAVLLLARGEVVPAETIADAVWGERPPADGASALQAYVSHLRRSLQPGVPARERSAVIVRQGSGYAVRRPRDAVDAWRFEALLRAAESGVGPRRAGALLEEALALWRGPALVEYVDEPWAAPEVARLTGLRTVARERLLSARLDVDEPALLVPELEAMTGEEPLREERWRLLALALYRSHRQADALAALRRARTTLVEELGVEPGPVLRELESEMLSQAPSLVLPRQRTRAQAPPTHGGLVGRERERDELTRLLDELAAGRHALLLVQGPSGIGKTRLLAEARRLAADRSATVLSARGNRLESAFAFGVVRQLFESVLADPARREQLLRGAAGAARSVFDHAEGGGPAVGRPVPDGAEDFAVLHGLYWLTANLAAERPLLLTVDDAPWCDGASLRFLCYLARRLHSLPVLLAVGLRPGDGEPPHDHLLGELAMEPDAVVIEPGTLSEAATAALVEHHLGIAPAPLFVTACHRTTAGSPLLITQLLRALAVAGVRPDAAHADRVVAVGSRAISSSVQVRLRQLPPDVAELARTASVLGDGAPLPGLAALAGVTESRAAEGLALLARAQVVTDTQPLAFAHPLVRDAVYEALPAAERGLRHERAAAVLRASGATDEQVAAHLLLAPPRGQDTVVSLLRAAATSAADRGAAESAATYLRRALAESPSGPWRSDLLEQLNRVESGSDPPADVADDTSTAQVSLKGTPR